MSLLKYAALGAVGAVAYKIWQKAVAGQSHPAPAAFAPAQGAPNDPAPVRDAGPAAMRDTPRAWDVEDQQSDESFPASDPPGNY
ncbi:MAG: hypothetical protein J7496_06995 [Novosphingobium sp.]|nr:hypothetical protein [Novosphingobium sp.]MBO9602238.1 hypothetical protein [Novosphingobium sp.]